MNGTRSGCLWDGPYWSACSGTAVLFSTWRCGSQTGRMETVRLKKTKKLLATKPYGDVCFLHSWCFEFWSGTESVLEVRWSSLRSKLWDCCSTVFFKKFLMYSPCLNTNCISCIQRLCSLWVSLELRCLFSQWVTNRGQCAPILIFSILFPVCKKSWCGFFSFHQNAEQPYFILFRGETDSFHLFFSLLIITFSSEILTFIVPPLPHKYRFLPLVQTG